MRNVKTLIYGKQYKDYFYTIKRLNNTKYGHPNFEVAIYKINKRFDIQAEVFHTSTYEDIYKYTENYINKTYYNKKGGE